MTCCGTADLGNAMLCSYLLIIHVYLMFLYTESSFLLISHSYYAIISLYEWMTETRFSFSTHTHEQHLQNCSESHFMSVSPFHLSKTILISYTHRNVKVFTGTRQNKSVFSKTVQQKYLFSRIYILLLKLSQNISNMF